MEVGVVLAALDSAGPHYCKRLTEKHFLGCQDVGLCTKQEKQVKSTYPRLSYTCQNISSRAHCQQFHHTDITHGHVVLY